MWRPRRTRDWVVLGVVALALVTVFTIWDAYTRNWQYSGFGPKTFWDWLDLLIVPVVLALSAVWSSRQEKRYEQRIADERIKEDRRIADKRIAEDRRIAEERTTEDRRLAEERAEVDRKIADQRVHEEREIAQQRAYDASLQAYLDQMTVLLLDKKLRESDKGSEVRAVAGARTLTASRQLNKPRRVQVLRFLVDTGLSTEGTTIVSFLEADMQEYDFSGSSIPAIDLSGADLTAANFSNTFLGFAFFNNAVLKKANLKKAVLGYTTFTGADFGDADLSEAELVEADLTNVGLSGANLTATNLSGAYYNDNTVWPLGFDPRVAGAVKK